MKTAMDERHFTVMDNEVASCPLKAVSIYCVVDGK